METAESLQNYWIPHLLVVTNPIPVVAVGNKVDLADSRRQAQEELDDLKEALGVTGFLSSAKTGQNVEAGFLALAKSIIAQSDAKMSRREAVEEATHEFIAVTDQIIMDFCDGMGGQEAAMPIVRQQLTRAGLDVKAPTREGLRLAVHYPAEPEASSRSAADFEAVRGIVLRAQQGERIEAGRDSTETNFATPDAMAVEASGSEALLRQHP